MTCQIDFDLYFDIQLILLSNIISFQILLLLVLLEIPP